MPSLAKNCQAKTIPQLPQYIIGYGSLIDEQSKIRSDPTARESFLTLIEGYKRNTA